MTTLASPADRAIKIRLAAHAADALDEAGLNEHAARLRDLPPNVAWGEIVFEAADAAYATYADAAAAYDAAATAAYTVSRASHALVAAREVMEAAEAYARATDAARAADVALDDARACSDLDDAIACSDLDDALAGGNDSNPDVVLATLDLARIRALARLGASYPRLTTATKENPACTE